jgi:hypothetical protein
MAVFSNPIFTNEGRALMADIIANQGTAVFKEAWLSSTNYVGSEETLTAATFAGTFLVDNNISASKYDNTVIGTEVTVDNSTLLVDQNLYTIGIILDDNGTDVLLCVSTTSSPEPIPAFVDNPIKFAYQFMLTVSSTQSISIVGSLAGIVYKGDIRDVLTSSESDKPLSARMGKKLADEKQDATLATPLTINGNTESTVETALGGLNDYSDALKDNLAANENVYGAKNENAYPYEDTTKADSGITFTDNGDGSVTVSGTAGANTQFNCHHVKRLTLSQGKHKINGCPVGGSGAWYINITEYINGVYSTIYTVDENGVEITADNTKSYGVYVWVASGTSISTPITFYPMIRDARILDDTFAPYAPTNREAMSFRANGKVGSKNFLKNNLSTTTTGDVTYTINNDGSITVSGTPSSDSWVTMRGFTIPKGKYILSGIRGYSVQNMKWDSLVLFSNGTVVQTFNFGGGYGTQDDAIFDTLPYTYDEVAVVLSRYQANVACSGTVYPMIRIVEDTDPTYQPYSKTNKQLTNDKAERNDLSTIHATGSTNTTGATIANGTFFYLNGQFCKALTNIAANATFTLNTNYSVDTVGAEIASCSKRQYSLLKNATNTDGTVVYTLNDNISNYKELALYLRYSNQILGGTIILTSLLGTNDEMFASIPMSNDLEYARVKKLSDTTVNLWTKGTLSGSSAWLYGIN